jgi:hypothetical protein
VLNTYIRCLLSMRMSIIMNNCNDSGLVHGANPVSNVPDILSMVSCAEFLCIERTARPDVLLQTENY